jgi:glycosyltransferase involved in cell wall biosynthesis
MRIGIVPTVNSALGGVYQYSLTMLHALDAWRSDGCEDEFVVFASGVPHPALVSTTGHGWTLKPLMRPSLPQRALDGLRRIVGEGPHREAWRWLHQEAWRWLRRSRALRWDKTPLRAPEVVRTRPEMQCWLHRCGIDLMLYPTPSALSFETGLPYVMAIHDLQHRLQPEFPEVSANGEWERREYYFRNGARYATLLLADSEVGKEDILNFYGPYGVTPDRVKVLPFLPACYLALDVPESERQRVRVMYSLPENYVFYPAQFWPHKNHIRIVQALGLLKQAHQLKIPVVFCGSYEGTIRDSTFREVMRFSSQMGLKEEIHYLGYAPDKDMSGLYAGAAALVMPTFFGPTNIPILEAWAFGCPVLTSDIRGVREQVGDAALLVDPTSVQAIADGIHQLWTDRELGRTLSDLGRRRLSAYTPEDYLRRLIEIIEEGKERVRSENPPHAKSI